ncbi:MAG: response regulator transcription factor [Candidatus Saccharicenans sp.]|jgi:DNA-binding response OmpR family regulator|nr:response regulator transcription factor [Candidatus Saccharicenans sp.]MDH7574628.1 response regulator transcription factor [Candidatus Saccharicenans sp.]
MKKILIIEDDRSLLEALVLALQDEGYRVLQAMDGAMGLDLALREKIDLAVIDMVLPSLCGYDICRKIREKGLDLPILLLSGKKKEEIDKVLGLEIGADDYLVKPFGMKEFVARVHALLRRARPPAREVEEYAFDDVRLDFRQMVAYKGKQKLDLTPKEFALLKYLVSHEGEVVSRETILNEVWGYDQFPTTRTVDTFIYGLRKKIEKNPRRPAHLVTVPWAGYKFQK